MPTSRARSVLWALSFCVALLFGRDGSALGPPESNSGSSPGREGDAIFDLSVEDLMNVRVSLASKTEQAAEEAPSIVSVVTRREIEAQGARELRDILRLVPGFEFGLDVFSLMGLGFRGVWVHEGKILVMINGICVNDLAYGNVQYFGTFPASMIERVEIVRGPASALYGGFAEAGVINIITRSGEGLRGAVVRGSVGVMGSELTRSGNISLGTKTDDIQIAAHIGSSFAPLSSRSYQDFAGSELALGNANSGGRWMHLVTEAVYKESLTLRYNRTSFSWRAQDAFTTIAPPVNGQNVERPVYTTDGLNIKYRAKLSQNFVLEPTLEFIAGPPIAAATNGQGLLNFNADGSYGGYYMDSNLMSRYRGELAAYYDLGGDSKLVGGVGYIRDQADSISDNGSPGLQLGPNDFVATVHTNDWYGYLEYLQRLGEFGVTAGGRYESTTFGNAFAPRVGLTYFRDAFNAKLLYGRSFRVPMPFQAYSRAFGIANQRLSPEISNTGELELGYRFDKATRLKLVPYYSQVSNPIVYNGSGNIYENRGNLRTYGIEAELSIRQHSYGGFMNLSQAWPGPGSLSNYLTEDGKRWLALPPFKASLGGYSKIGDFELSPTLTYLSTRYGQSRDSALSTPVVPGSTAYDPVFLANLSISWNELIRDSTLRLIGQNIFGAKYLLIQAYNGGHAPLPADDREVRLEFQTHL